MLEEICLKERKVSKNEKAGDELEGWHQGIYIYNYAPISCLPDDTPGQQKYEVLCKTKTCHRLFGSSLESGELWVLHLVLTRIMKTAVEMSRSL